MSREVFAGLQVLEESAFPKRCASCGYVYQTSAQFFAETLDMPRGRSSLKSGVDDDGNEVVEVFRNCQCGSTLMDAFGCRRQPLEQGGEQRRAEFKRIYALLLERNISEAQARTEIINFLRGKPNQLRILLAGGDGGG